MSRAVAEMMETSDAPLMDQNLLESGIYTISEGKTWVVGSTRRGYLPLCGLNERDVLGRVPFLDIGHEPHRASVLSQRVLRVEALDSGALNQEYETLSQTFKGLIHNAGSCISETTRIACRS